MSKELDILRTSVVVPVVVLERVEDAKPLAEALLQGGIGIIEITLRTQVALKAIELLARDLPEMKVGAGTVTSPELMQSVNDAGASFSLSPGISSDLLAISQTLNMPFIPGVASASEVMLGLNHGKTCFKLFPAAPIGGVALLKAFQGPFPAACFCPTGGIDSKNMKQFLACDNVVSVGGSWVCPGELIKTGQWLQISDFARSALATS